MTTKILGLNEANLDAAVLEFYLEHGHGATVKEIADILTLSESTVRRTIAEPDYTLEIERGGYTTREMSGPTPAATYVPKRETLRVHAIALTGALEEAAGKLDRLRFHVASGLDASS